MDRVKCPKCEINYLEEGEEMCSVCKKSIRTFTQNRGKILGNDELNGQKFEISLSGYGDYLKARNYGTFSANGNMTTILSYARAIVKIAELESMSFEEMFSDINRLVDLYGLEGKKREIGEYQKGTWRNALNRLQDFKEYTERYMK